jgi:hypothetical protein
VDLSCGPPRGLPCPTSLVRCVRVAVPDHHAPLRARAEYQRGVKEGLAGCYDERERDASRHCTVTRGQRRFPRSVILCWPAPHAGPSCHRPLRSRASFPWLPGTAWYPRSPVPLQRVQAIVQATPGWPLPLVACRCADCESLWRSGRPRRLAGANFSSMGKIDVPAEKERAPASDTAPSEVGQASRMAFGAMLANVGWET